MADAPNAEWKSSHKYYNCRAFVCPRKDDEDNPKRRFSLNAVVGVSFADGQPCEILSNSTVTLFASQPRGLIWDWETRCARVNKVKARLSVEADVRRQQHVGNAEPILKEVHKVPLISMTLLFTDTQDGAYKELKYVFDFEHAKYAANIETAKKKHLKKHYDALLDPLCVGGWEGVVWRCTDYEGQVERLDPSLVPEKGGEVTVQCKYVQ